MIYYIYINKEQKGPLTLEELTQYDILQTTKVWREDQPAWKDAKDFEELTFLSGKLLPLTVAPTPQYDSSSHQSDIMPERQLKVRADYRKYLPVIVLIIVLLIGFCTFMVYKSYDQQLEKDIQRFQMQQEYNRNKK